MEYLVTLFISLYTIFLVDACVNDNLLAVIQMTRHGHRTPLRIFKNDVYQDKDKYWEGLELGQLTKIGRQQHYNLGKFTRQRYSDWMPETYKKEDIHVESTDYDRTHMSAESNMYGLYPASGAQQWLDTTDWQAIPVHPSNPRNAVSCPAYNKLAEKYSAIEEQKIHEVGHDFLYQYLSEKTGDNITNSMDVALLYDALKVEQVAGLPLPTWADSVFPDPMATYVLRVYKTTAATSEMLRYASGPILREFMNFFEKKLEDPTSVPKYKFYSSHDGNLVHLLEALGNTLSEPVPFAASVYLELRNINSTNVVNLWYKETDKITKMSIRNCDLDCPFTEVEELLSDFTLDEKTWEKECGIL